MKLTNEQKDEIRLLLQNYGGPVSEPEQGGELFGRDLGRYAIDDSQRPL